MKKVENKTRRNIWLVSGFFLIVGVFVIFYSSISTIILGEFQFSNDLSPFIRQQALKDSFTPCWIMIFVGIIVALISLVLFVMKCGKKLPDGTIDQSRWYDHIFTDLLIWAGMSVTSLVVPAGILYFDWFERSSLLREWILPAMMNDPSQLSELYKNMNHLFLYYTFEPLWVELTASLILLGIVVVFDMYVIQSVAKRLKNHRFWKDSLIGWIIRKGKLMVDRIEKRYMNLYMKAGLVLLGMAVVSLITAAFTSSFGVAWFLLLVMTGVLLYYELGKYTLIREGISEMKSGNLEHTIPLSGKGELDQAAADLNNIMDVQKLAVARELKNERLKTDLISNVSHDLKTPLTSIVTYLDLLEKEGLQSESAPEYLGILQAKSSRLQKLTEDLFEASKASSGALPVNLEQINLVSLVNQAMAELEDRLQGADLNLQLNVRDDAYMVTADGRLLWRVIENLLTNVSKYAMPGSRVYIDILKRHEMVRLEMKNVSRDPLNIEPDELLERFQRGDRSRNTDGSGLGLTIARDLTTLMDGRFWIHIDGDLFKAIVEVPAC